MQVTVTDTTLFHVAATWLSDATSWDRIANLNGLDDPMVIGTVTLTLPALGAPLIMPTNQLA